MPEHNTDQNNAGTLSMPHVPPPAANYVTPHSSATANSDPRSVASLSSSSSAQHLQFTQGFPYGMDYGTNNMTFLPMPSSSRGHLDPHPRDYDRTHVPPGEINNQGDGSFQPQGQVPHAALQYRIVQSIPYIAQAAPSSSGSASSPRDGLNDPEELPILEDKRQRNTVASARFRIKKKQRTLNLEQTVSDLTSRAKELEREAINLRRENTWLKEIVIMKGRQNMAAAVSTPNEEPSASHSKASAKDQSASEDSDTDGERRKRKKKTKGKAKA